MAPVKITDVICFSSEDPVHTTENIVSGQGKWLCAKNEKSLQLEAIFQLEKTVKISYIDLGNHGSAFIEIYVKRSLQKRDFQLLLPSATLMTPTEQKQGINTTKVAMFTEENFVKAVAKEKWDRLKIVCRSLPRAAKKQFGISFLAVRTSESNAVLEDAIQIVELDSYTKDQQSHIAKGKRTPVSSSPLSRREQILNNALSKRKYSVIPRTFSKQKGHGKVKGSSPGKLITRNSTSQAPETPPGILSEIAKRALRYSPHCPQVKPLTNKEDSDIDSPVSKTFIEEVACFLGDINFHTYNLDEVKFIDLRLQMEKQRGCSLTSKEKKAFYKLAEKAVQRFAESLQQKSQEVVAQESGSQPDQNSSLDIEDFLCPHCSLIFSANAIVEHAEACAYLRTQNTGNPMESGVPAEAVMCNKCGRHFPIYIIDRHEHYCDSTGNSSFASIENVSPKQKDDTCAPNKSYSGTEDTSKTDSEISHPVSDDELEVLKQSKNNSMRSTSGQPTWERPVTPNIICDESDELPSWVLEQSATRKPTISISPVVSPIKAPCVPVVDKVFLPMETHGGRALTNVPVHTRSQISNSASPNSVLHKASSITRDLKEIIASPNHYKPSLETSAEVQIISKDSDNKELVQCPLCGGLFEQEDIMVHADLCADIRGFND